MKAQSALIKILRVKHYLIAAAGSLGSILRDSYTKREPPTRKHVHMVYQYLTAKLQQIMVESQAAFGANVSKPPMPESPFTSPSTEASSCSSDSAPAAPTPLTAAAALQQRGIILSTWLDRNGAWPLSKAANGTDGEPAQLPWSATSTLNLGEGGPATTFVAEAQPSLISYAQYEESGLMDLDFTAAQIGTLSQCFAELAKQVLSPAGDRSCSMGRACLDPRPSGYSFITLMFAELPILTSGAFNPPGLLSSRPSLRFFAYVCIILSGVLINFRQICCCTLNFSTFCLFT